MSEPAVTLQAVHDDGPGNLPPTRVVIHATNPQLGYPAASQAGRALSTAVYFQSPNSGGSAHYVEDIAGEQHCAADRDICWHAPPNQHSIGIEICAEGGQVADDYTRDQWLSPQVWPAVQRAAARTAELCSRFGIPTVRIGAPELLAGAHGICGHSDVVAAWHESDHSDPGPNFPWPEFMAAVTSTTPAPVAPTPSASREVDPVTAIPITVRSDGTFRGTLVTESGGNSQVVAQAWLDMGSTWGGCGMRATALGNNGNVLAVWPPTPGLGTIPNNATVMGVVLPAGTCMVTVEGKVADPNAGTIPAASVVSKTR